MLERHPGSFLFLFNKNRERKSTGEKKRETRLEREWKERDEELRREVGGTVGHSFFFFFTKIIN